MQSTFQAGVDSIYNAIAGQGTTPAGKTPAQLVAAVSTLATNKYNAGNSAGYTSGYNAGKAAAVKTVTLSVQIRSSSQDGQKDHHDLLVYANNALVYSGVFDHCYNSTHPATFNV